MNDFFKNYVTTAFDGNSQATFKFSQFDYNYRKYFPRSFNRRLLDIGVGRGEMLSCMNSWGYDNYEGVDISPSTINFCQRLGLNCSQTEDTATWLAARLNCFDIITCLDVVEHVPRDASIEFMTAIRHALTSEGIAIIQVPNLQAPDGHLHHFNDITHVVGFIEHSMSQLLKNSGFSSYEFSAFEEFVPGRRIFRLRRALRSAFHRKIRFERWLNGNINPRILTPVFYVAARK
jgi:2-polyprenyl-3-methyl-5-hydroxy-6-metoxy-1,4-benzoquinol methylase